MTYYEWQMQAAATANAADDSGEQKTKSDYVAELADHLDVETNALAAALDDATVSTVKALLVELGPGGGEPTGNAAPSEAYPAGPEHGWGSTATGPSTTEIEAARERVMEVVANSEEHDDRKIGDMEIWEVLSELQDRFVTKEDVEARLGADDSPTSNAGATESGAGASAYPDGTIGSRSSSGGRRPTGNADSGRGGLDEYPDGTLGGF